MGRMERGCFYGHYALRNLWREGRRSAFALFCVAAGVAAIVALETLGLALGEALTGNARAGNRGDVAAILGGDEFFTPQQMAAFEQLVDRGKATSPTLRYRTQKLLISRLEGEGAGQGLLVESFLVDPTAYPLCGQIEALDPPGALLAALLAALEQVRRETGTALVPVTHDPAVAGLAERLIRPEDGRVVDRGQARA